MPQFLQTSDSTFINVDEIHSATLSPNGSIVLGVQGAEKQIVTGDYAAELLKVLGAKPKEQHTDKPVAKAKEK